MSILKKSFFVFVTIATLVGCQSEKGPKQSSKLANDTIKIVTWNMEAMFSPEMVLDRLDDLKNLYAEQAPDVLLVQEVTSKDILDTIRNLLGLEGYETVISDFSEDGKGFYSLEVGAISRYPLDQIVEYDPIPDGRPAGEKPIEVLTDYGIEAAKVYRGILSFEIKGTDFRLFNIHLKSSRGKVGKGDWDNAKKREVVVAYLAKRIADEAKTLPEATFLVAGDFNVGHSDEKKNGTDLSVDSLDYKTDKGKDLYDETHALLTNGLIEGLKMRSLSRHIKESSYPAYPGTPIDNILVYGKYANRFEEAKKCEKTYGSDHTPMITTVVMPVDASVVQPVSKAKVLPPDPLPNVVKMIAILANPEGDEKVNEKVVLKNITTQPINLTGWVLKDKANTEWALSSLGNLAPGEEKAIRRNGQPMSLNNTNEVVRLLNNKGELMDRVSYFKTEEGKLLTFGK
jgi:exonuclease III